MDGYTFATPYRTDSRPMLSNQIHAVAVDSQHVKWFTSDKGISTFNGSDWGELTVANNLLIQDWVTSIGIDNDSEKMWRYFGTKDQGVSRVFYEDVEGLTSALAYNTQSSGLVSNEVHAIFVVSEQQHWIGTSDGVAKHDSTETKEHWRLYSTDEGLVNDTVISIAMDHNDNMWFGTKKGVSHFNGSKFTNFTTADGLSGNIINDIQVDQDGSLWFATNGGVSHFVPAGNSVQAADNKPKMSI